MKLLASLLLTILLIACAGNNNKKIPCTLNTAKVMDTSSTQVKDSAADGSETAIENAMATYYVVVADTGKDYFRLRKQLMHLSRISGIPIDTMGRYYNTTKDEIILPQDDEDEIYRGEYFPRRFPSENLSLEYLNGYSDASGKRTIALLTGIYETRQTADSARLALLKQAPKTFVLRSELYIGCMH